MYLRKKLNVYKILYIPKIYIFTLNSSYENVSINLCFHFDREIKMCGRQVGRRHRLYKLTTNYLC